MITLLHIHLTIKNGFTNSPDPLFQIRLCRPSFVCEKLKRSSSQELFDRQPLNSDKKIIGQLYIKFIYQWRFTKFHFLTHPSSICKVLSKALFKNHTSSPLWRILIQSYWSRQTTDHINVLVPLKTITHHLYLK